MSIRTIRQCDRCRREVTTAEKFEEFTHRGDKKDLCGSCASKLSSFLSGRELDDPP